MNCTRTFTPGRVDEQVRELVGNPLKKRGGSRNDVEIRR
jgi:hypothetical protein